MKNVTFRQIRVFTEVARHLNFARAAEALHLTPPAVTMQIKELEAAIDLLLFDRQGRSVSLTTAGEYFLVYARRLQATLKDAEDAMARLRKLQTGLLTVGIVSTAKYFVPRLLVRFQDENPGIEVKLQVCNNREQLTALLQANEVDLAVMGRTPREIAMRSEPFAAHPLVFIAPPGHPLGRRGHPPLALLESHPFIVREAASGTRAAMDAFFSERQFTPRIGMEMGSNESIKQAVMAGMGLGFVSLHTVGLELRAGALQIIHVEGTPLMRTWFIAHRQSRVLSPAAEAFRYFMLEHAETFLAAHDRPLLEDDPAHRPVGIN